MSKLFPSLARLAAYYSRRFSRFATREYAKIELFEERVRRVRGDR